MLAIVLVVVPVAISVAGTSAASYHWAREKSHFTLKVGDNVSGNWDKLLPRTLGDWNKNDTVKLDEASGQTNPQQCRPTRGRVEVCNWRYGTHADEIHWLGLTTLYLDRGHIEAATVQINDSFLNAGSYYNTDEARRHTLCHELGHTIGLGHPNTRSCMNNSDFAVFHYLKPIPRDFRELKRIYDHQDRETTISSASVASEEFVAPASLPAEPSGPDANETVTVQTLDDGREVITFITWAKD
jgi:hypothetical protein